MADSGSAQRVAAVRRFNRFYTQQIGLLQERRLYSPFSLAEARVLYELAHREPRTATQQGREPRTATQQGREQPTATELGRELGLDAGYLSRILRGFARQGLIKRQASAVDGRRSLLSMTRSGRAAFARLNARSKEQVGALLKPLPAARQGRLVAAMHAVETLLGPADASPAGENRAPYLLRPHRSGDMGWVIQAHGVLYAQEYRWDEQFEALVAEIAAKFIQRFDPQRERCWIAEMDGEPVGSVFLVKQSATVGKLRLLIVDPKARGLGIGKRLVEECLHFARQADYRKVMLWTNSVLLAARHIYVEAGFQLIHREPHHSFGHDLVGETWELKL